MVYRFSVNLKKIQNILTLRYDPDGEPALPHKTIDDYIPIESDWTTHIANGLEDVIFRTLANKERIGIALSSGVDSVLLLALIKQVYPEKKIIAITDPSSGELEAVKKIVGKYKIPLVTNTTNDLISEIPWYVELTGEPRWNVYHHHIWEAAKKKDCDVLVTGDGADELFGGYVFRYSQYMKGEPYWNCHRNDHVDDQGDLLKSCTGEVASKFLDITSDQKIENCLMRDYNGKLLHDFLPTGRAIAKHYNMPTIQPYLELRDGASHIPINRLFNSDFTIGKLPLRELAVYLDAPVSQNKIGYTINIKKIWSEHNTRSRFDGLWEGTWTIFDKIINHEWVWKHRFEDDDIRIINKFLQLYALECYINPEHEW